jgi:integrase
MASTWKDGTKPTRYPGILKTPTGFRIRVRATDPRNGTMKEANQNFEGITLEQAIVKQAELKAGLRSISRPEEQSRRRFAEYAESLTRDKIARGKLSSESTKVQWASVLDLHLIPAFGGWYLDAIRRQDIQAWQLEQAKRVRAGELSPHTANQRLRVLFTVLRAAVIDLDLERDPTRGIEPLDTSTWKTYTEEEPNALTPEEVARFLAKANVVAPQHYAFLALGFATGRRPSELRPLRREGPTPDILWADGVMLVRRSETKGVVMDKTKTGRKLRVPLPVELTEILRWHVRNLPAGPMRDSDLLFPSDVGGFRSSTCLTKPIAAILKATGITKHISPRAMRRTYQDLARQAHVHDFVARAISGHETVEMHDHYSTVAGDEVRQGLGRVIQLVGLRRGDAGGEVTQKQALQGTNKAA